MSKEVILTRYLYLFDEVGLSFISSILKADSIDECYFWMSELYLSGLVVQSWDLIWFIYYDFYYILNPQFEPFIHKKSVVGDFKSILAVTKNLFKMKSSSSSEVFITRQYNYNIKEITRIFKGKKPKWLSEIPDKYHGLFRFLDKKLYHFAVSSLPDTVEPDLFQAIQTYFKLSDEQRILFQEGFYELGTDTTTSNKATKDSEQTDYTDKNKDKHKYVYKNYVHKVWAIICLLTFHPDYIQCNSVIKKKLYIAYSDSEYDEFIKKQNELIPLDKYNNTQVRKTLEHKRLYAIDPLCSSFQLLRDNVSDMNERYYHHWEYYTYFCPLWTERFNQYDITIDNDKEKIIFNDDLQLEEFYAQYGYEPDEQSNETDSKRILHMSSHNWKDWYDSIFTQKPIYEFNDDFRFRY